ncbi:sugar phosphate isomerase/epimerase family protein [Pseudactinotalea sp.]|uniref:sugar phosphate isomerase/epimerase family protein n=1 Tax=Pseudactinotalea sp. TaxID=1926260 RepID=UPI003B3B2630
MSRGWTLAASTLGAVEESLEDVAAICARHGASAVELRTASDAPVHVDLSAAQRREVRAIFDGAGIGILTVASRVRIASDDGETLTSLRAHLDLAADLGARYVRVFPGAPAAPAAPDELPTLDDRDQADATAVERLVDAADQAADRDLGILVETHDSHPRGADVARILDRVGDHAAVGAIWDLLHPWRVGEQLEATARHLMPYLLDERGYVQIKDVPSRQNTFPVLQGAGQIPLDAALALLSDSGYSGPLALEWERHWQRDAAPLEDAVAAAVSALAQAPSTSHPRR